MMILVPAQVLKIEEKSYLVRLFDGFGENIIHIHKSMVIPWCALRRRKKK